MMSALLNRLVAESPDIYRESRAWCQMDTTDYCPLVIGLMSSIILLTVILIIYLCAHTSVSCFRRKETVSNIRESITMPRTNQVGQSRQNQFTKSNRPPPSYEETVAKPKFNRVIRTYPREKRQFPVHVNSAFSIENERPTVVFPEYQCVSLTTTPPPTTTNSSTIPRRVINNGVQEVVISIDHLFQNEEVPPPYDSIYVRSNDPDVVYF